MQPLLNTRSVAVPSLLSGVTDQQVESLLLAAKARPTGASAEARVEPAGST